MTLTRTAPTRRLTMSSLSTEAPKPAEQSLLPTALDDAVAAEAPTQLLTPKEAAAILAVTPRMLERWRMTGEGPRYLKLSRATVRYTAADLGAFQTGAARNSTTQKMTR